MNNFIVAFVTKSGELDQTLIKANSTFEAIGKVIEGGKSIDDGTILMDKITCFKQPVELTESKTLTQEVINLLKTESKFCAIKHYRFVTDLGLKESKQAVDKIQDEYKVY